MYCSTRSLHSHLTCSTRPPTISSQSLPPSPLHIHAYTHTYIRTYVHTSTYTLHVFGHLVLLLYGAVVLNGQDHWVVRHSKGMVLDGLNGIFEHDLAGEGVTMVDYRVILITIPTVHCNTEEISTDQDWLHHVLIDRGSYVRTYTHTFRYVHTYVLCTCTVEYKQGCTYVCYCKYAHVRTCIVQTHMHAPPSLTCTHTITPHMQSPTHTRRICSQP